MSRATALRSSAAHAKASPLVRHRSHETQQFGSITPLSSGLDPQKLTDICEALNRVLADAMTLRDLYKKHHWQVAGPTFYQLNLLFDEHLNEQVALVDLVAERIQLLGRLSYRHGARCRRDACAHLHMKPRGSRLLRCEVDLGLEQPVPST